jgi:hypothetical protein
MIIIDNFIEDLDFLKRIEEDKDFWKVGYNWYPGWWEEPITTLRHELIQRIWGENSPHPNVEVGGFEHWVGDYNENDVSEVLNREWALKLHFDKDEEMWNNSKTFVTPKIGTVFYPCREIDEMEGGMLYYWDRFGPAQTTDNGYIYWPDYEPEIIKPKFNRLVIFDAGKLHGVSKITKGRRRAIAINLWDNAPSEFTKDY